MGHTIRSSCRNSPSTAGRCTWEGKKSILQVALDNQIEIPHYCYHPGMSVVASCRICLAEVGAPQPANDNKVELIPKLVPTCQTPAAEGMEVHLKNSPKTIANQKSVMEMLLINHPLDCPVCDQAGECSLQDYSYSYGRSQSRFEETKIKQPKKDLGPHVLLYSDRCIMCSRCVRFTREVSGTSEIGIFGRGSNEQIDVFPGKPLDNELFRQRHRHLPRRRPPRQRFFDVHARLESRKNPIHRRHHRVRRQPLDRNQRRQNLPHQAPHQHGRQHLVDVR